MAVGQRIQEMAAEPGGYEAADIRVLEGLEAVRKRPGMYIGSTGPRGLHECVREVVDNSVDEAMAGHCSRIDVTLLADGGCRVADNGRGIPVAPHPQYPDRSAAELVLTTLHAGGKFGGSGYKVSGGLHGVGVSVVNALAVRLVLEIDRDGKHHVLEFADGGKPQGKLRAVGSAPRGRTGTTVTFWPDGTIFEETEFRAQTILERLQTYAFLNRGLEFHFRDERPGHEHEVVYRYNGGIIDFARHLNETKEPLFRKVAYFEAAEDDQECEVALQWNTGYYESIYSFANGIGTPEGGTHEEGFKKSLTNVVNKYARSRNLLKEKEDNLLGEDIREGLTAIISVRLREPQFEGQTKNKLGNVSMRSLVEQTVDVAYRIRERLQLSDDELPVRTLMGGVEPSELRDWRLEPERDQILIGTIDMLLSRALNRGYAESRFAWPIAFGLLNNDCRWIFDEVQLMGSARATSAQLDALRSGSHRSGGELVGNLRHTGTEDEIGLSNRASPLYCPQPGKDHGHAEQADEDRDGHEEVEPDAGDRSRARQWEAGPSAAREPRPVAPGHGPEAEVGDRCTPELEASSNAHEQDEATTRSLPHPHPPRRPAFGAGL